MDDRRMLPATTEHRELVVKVGGEAVSREHRLLSATITKAVNRVSWARLTYADGSPATSDFPLSNTPTFAPGSKVEVLAGPLRDATSIFQGVVVRQSIRVRGASSQLVVECRHEAFKLTLGRRSACFLDRTDAEVMSTLLEGAGLRGDIADTPLKHPALVQYQSSNWDFLLTRAEANGRLVFTNDATVAVKAPSTGSDPVVTLLYGATILELDAEVDARQQFDGVESATWDPAQQAVVSRGAEEPEESGPGDLAPGDLAAVGGAGTYQLRHVAIGEDEAQAWADAQWLRARLSKVSGRAKCDGFAAVNPGDVIDLRGVGSRFSGKVFVTGVRHDSDPLHGWKTHVQFGSVERAFADDSTVSAPPASGLLPGVSGLQIGVVTSNEDPDGEHRVRVRLPMVAEDSDGVWARVASLDAGAERGFFFRPELGDEVVVGFFDGDPRRAVMLGMLHSSAKAAPLEGTDDNHEKAFQSRSGMRIYFDDEKTVTRWETPAGNRVTLSEDDRAVRVEDQHGNVVELNADGIRIESKKALTLKAATAVKIESGAELTAKGGSDLTLEGSSSAELSCPATTSVKGGLVKIN